MAFIGSYATSNTYAATLDLYPVNVGNNLYLAIDRTARTQQYQSNVGNFRYDAVSEHPVGSKEVCVLVIGETSRADNWELFGYNRPTNPRLFKRRHELILAPQAYSESNTTHKAVPLLMSPVSAENFGEEIFHTKSLITAFKEAGWHTTFISDQDPNHSFVEFFSAEADDRIYVPRKKGDFVLLPALDSVLNCNNEKQLIVLHTYGSHFSYADRYEERDRKFLPDNYTAPVAAQRPLLLNAYDNSIIATDRFLDEVLRRLEERDCISSLLYASDHGEDIYDDGKHFLHASPLPDIHQVHVAMFAWLSKGYKAAYPGMESLLRDNMKKMVSSSRSYCPTAFGLAGISTRLTSKEESGASLTSARYHSVQRIYLNDHNKAVTLASIVE